VILRSALSHPLPVAPPTIVLQIPVAQVPLWVPGRIVLTRIVGRSVDLAGWCRLLVRPRRVPSSDADRASADSRRQEACFQGFRSGFLEHGVVLDRR
jgi:hypothetical protein